MRIIGHRGARGLFPENTLEGFLRTAALGVDWIELDVGMTADGIVVVCHDLALTPDLTRDAWGRWLSPPGPLLRSLTGAELAHYDVGRIKPGSRSSLRFLDQQPHDGARVPTLASVLAALPGMSFIIEVKRDPRHPDQTAEPALLADAVLSVVDAAAAADRVVIESFDWRVPHYIGRIRPELRLAWLTRAETVRECALWWDSPVDPDSSAPARVAAASRRSGGQIWAPDYTDLTEALVLQAHALGLVVVPWTVNLPDDMARLAAWRVDGLISDRPDLALQWAR